jgi:uncharacterized membrane protein
VNLTQYKALFILVTAVLALLVASPALQRVLISPQTSFFTELSLLGPRHTTENYPYGITKNVDYTVFLGITNQIGSCAYYQVELKFRNKMQSATDSSTFTPSSLPSLYNMTAIVANKESLEIPVIFALDYSLTGNSTFPQVTYNSLRLNDVTINLRDQTSDWNQQTKTVYGNLIFELWIYNSTISGFQYNERFVNLKLNMTSTNSLPTF